MRNILKVSILYIPHRVLYVLKTYDKLCEQIRHLGISKHWMRSSRVVRASGCQCQSRNSLGFDPSILRHSGIWETADEAVLTNVHKKKNRKHPGFEESVNTQILLLSKNFKIPKIKLKIFPFFLQPSPPRHSLAILDLEKLTRFYIRLSPKCQ